MINNEKPIQTDNKIYLTAQALRNSFRQQIFELLANQSSLSFNELMNNLNISQPKLAYHLQILMKFNIITNFYDKREGIKDHSFYQLSAFGRELMVGVYPITINNSPQMQTQTSITDKDSQSSTNFRTIRHIEYKSYEDFDENTSSPSIKSMKNKGRKYIDPIINCAIINKSSSSTNSDKINLPAFRKYYKLYKRSFKSDQNIESKY